MVTDGYALMASAVSGRNCNAGRFLGHLTSPESTSVFWWLGYVTLAASC
jgi:hypothetical protein